MVNKPTKSANDSEIVGCWNRITIPASMKYIWLVPIHVTGDLSKLPDSIKFWRTPHLSPSKQSDNAATE